MIKLRVNHKHKRDIYELVRAFFPGQELAYSKEGEEAQIESLIKGTLVRTRVNLEEVSGEDKRRLEDFKVFSLLGNPESKLVKYSLYSILKNYKELDWGILTGIRPGKLARQVKKEGLDLYHTLGDLFFVSSKKISLLEDIYQAQEPVINKYSQGYSLYINIPFCPTVCSYCSYPVMPIKNNEDLAKAHSEKLIEEIDFVYRTYGKPSMAYIGGGTPSAIPNQDLGRIVDKALSLGPLDEFTVELGREDTIDKELLNMLRDRVDRICINPQSMVEKTSRLIGRKQTNEGVVRAYDLARSYGFKVNMDTIIGLPGEGEAEVRRTFNRLAELSPDNITVHSLAYKKGSRLREKGWEKRQGASKLAEISQQILKDNSYFPYYLYRQKDMVDNLENIGYSKEGKVCAYNIVSMEESQSIVGVGMGAVSKFIVEARPVRRANFKSMDAYLERFDEVLARKILD